MKTVIFTVLTVFLISGSTSKSVELSSTPDLIKTKSKVDTLNESGFEFFIRKSSINTKYTEFASSVFRNKLIMVSSKKIGAIGNGIDTHTNEPYTELFCLDIDSYGTLSNPLLFSRIINTKSNEGQVSFSPDEKTMYFTRSTRDNSKNYQLFKARLEVETEGNWIDEIELSISSPEYSVENPFVNEDGTLLYFASNMPGSIGGYDLYVSKIDKDGYLGKPKNLGNNINTISDEKFPHVAKNGKSLYFSSKGHGSIGGFDVFVSKKVNNNYKAVRNLGIDVNSKFDEIAFVFIDDSKGFFSSNKKEGSGSFDIYRFKANAIYQNVQGIVVSKTNQPLPNTLVVLIDEDGQEIERQITGIDAHYSFKVKLLDTYMIKVLKQGFEPSKSEFSPQHSNESVYKKILKLSPKDDSNSK